jgi:hypothetical protein
MRTATIAIIAGIVMAACSPDSAIEAAAQPKQPQSAVTVDRTLGCPKDEDFDRYATLVGDDVSAAILFTKDHNCVMLAPGTFVKIDKGSVQRASNHVCIRPTGAYDCLWTFSAHIKAEDAR